MTDVRPGDEVVVPKAQGVVLEVRDDGTVLVDMSGVHGIFPADQVTPVVAMQPTPITMPVQEEDEAPDESDSGDED